MLYFALAIASMACADFVSTETNLVSLLDIVDPNNALRLQAMLNSSPDHPYIKSDLSDVDMLKVSALHAADDTVVTHEVMATIQCRCVCV